MLSALAGAEEYSIATKVFYVGELSSEPPPALLGMDAAPGAGPSAGPSVGTLLGPSGGQPAGTRGGPSPARQAGATLRAVLAVTGCDKANAAHTLTCLLEGMVPAPRLVLQVGIAGAFPFGPCPPQVGDIVLATHEAYSDTGSSSPDGWLSAADLGLPIACLDGLETGGRFPLDAGLVHAAAAIIEALDRPAAGAAGRAGVAGGAAAAGRAGVAGGAGAAWAAAALRRPAVLAGPCVTSSRVTGLRAEAEMVAARWGALAESMEGAAAAHICALYGVPFLEIRGISNLVVDRDRASWEVERAIAAAGRAALGVVAALDRLPLRASRAT